MSVATITPPVTTPVLLEHARHHVRADEGYDDVYLTALIEAATLLAEKWLGRSLITQTLEMRLDAFWSCPTLPLRRPPILAVTDIRYDDAGGDEVVLDDEAYRLVNMPDASLALAYGATSWPTPITGADAVRVRYTAGYGPAPGDVPMPIRQAILLFIGHWFANRETVLIGQTPAQLPIAAEALLSAYRVPIL